jgi:preprotein translocase subunit Sec61beta
MLGIEGVVPSGDSRWLTMNILLTRLVSTGLYTDESPGLKVDPVVVLVLSLVFIFSVVALHSKFSSWNIPALLLC